MGICDLIPGISGGTIAFITGIYERLILAVHRILSFQALNQLLFGPFLVLFGMRSSRSLKKAYTHFDIGFLITLFCGIAFAIYFGSHIITYLLDSYFALLMSFFIGLIITSALLIYRKIETHTFSSQIFGLLGILCGLCLLFLIPASVQINSFYLFLSGFFGVAALFLPGISGSFILYIMGSYTFILSAVSSLSIHPLFIFMYGAICGAFVISRVIRFVLLYYHSQTLYFLLGFVFGALAIPIRDIQVFSYPIYSIFLFFIIGLSGAIIIFLFEK